MEEDFLGRTGWKTKGKLFKLYYLLYVDDGAFIFTNRKDMIKGS